MDSRAIKETKPKFVIDKKKIKKKIKPIHKLGTIHQVENSDVPIMEVQPKRGGTTQIKDEEVEKAMNKEPINERPKTKQKAMIRHQNTIFNTDEMIVSQYLNDEISVRKGQSSVSLFMLMPFNSQT